MVKIYQIRGKKKKKKIEEIKLDGISIYVTFKCLISLVRFYSNPSTIIHFHAQKSIQKRNDCSPCCIRNMFNHFEFLISIKMEKISEFSTKNKNVINSMEEKKRDESEIGFISKWMFILSKVSWPPASSFCQLCGVAEHFNWVFWALSF